jgi:ribosomal protein S18 acetylase RimI-like enzyme
MSREEPVTIRVALPSEYDAAGDLVVAAYRTLGDVGGAFYEHELRDVAGRAQGNEVLVATVAGRLVGCVTFVEGDEPLSQTDDPDAATIRMLGVDTEARGRGVGEALVRACIDRARAAGRRRVRLDTRTSMKSAQRLYERLGFRRDPEHDWSPAEHILLLGYVLDLRAPTPPGQPDR